MELISQIPLVGGALSVVIPFLIVLGVVVFVHEFGHYIVGRWCGIHADVFSVGFGRELYGWTDRRGTRWRIALVPLGGYVKFVGDNDASSAVASRKMAELSAEERARSFPGAALWRRALTVTAGPVANFLLSIAIFALLAVGLGMPSNRPVIGAVDSVGGYSTPFRPGDEVLVIDGQPVSQFGQIYTLFQDSPGAQHKVTVRRDGHAMELTSPDILPAIVGSVAPESAAEKAGLEVGERILAVDGHPVRAFSDLRDLVGAYDGAPLTLKVETPQGAIRELSLDPVVQPIRNSQGVVEMRPLIGVGAPSLIDAERVTPGPFRAIGYGVDRTWGVIESSFAYIAAIVGGQADASALGGPVKIASISGEAAEQGVLTLVSMIALLSASIGMINLFPVPVLDGGHLLFYAIEALRGRPLNSRVLELATTAGFALVLLLMVLVTYNDIINF